jgi:hypothetical protein
MSRVLVRSRNFATAIAAAVSFLNASSQGALRYITADWDHLSRKERITATAVVAVCGLFYALSLSAALAG